MSSLRELVTRMQRLRGIDPFDRESLNLHLLRRLMSGERKRISKSWNTSKASGKSKTGISRTINGIVRGRYKRSGKIPDVTRDQRVMLLRSIRPSKLLDKLYPRRTQSGGWANLAQRDPTKEIAISLREFSFLENPRNTMEGLRLIAEAEATAAEAKIDFEDKYCLDVTPFMLLMECWGQMLPIFEGGKMDFPMQKVLAAIGIPQSMGITVEGVTNFENVWAFPLSRRRGAGSTESKAKFTDVQTREATNDEFCHSINSWLSEVGMELTDRGIGWIKFVIGELLENAERHSDGERKDGTWSISGCMVRRQNQSGEWVLQVYIGILNLGDTFSKTLERATLEVRGKLDSYVTLMKAAGAVQSAETLRTLAAIQDTVTCDPEADKSDRGGYGLQEMIELVNTLGSTDDENSRPAITIISGSSCIQLRGPYIQGHRVGGESEPRVLWCNDENSMQRPPNEEYVYDLGTELPGTAISIGFVLDGGFYSRTQRKLRENGED